MYLLDTNHISFIHLQQDPDVIKHLEGLPSNAKLTINAVIYSELIYMVEKSKKHIENRALLRHFIQKLDLRIYPLTEKTAEIYGHLHAKIFAYYAPTEKRLRRSYQIREAGVREHDLWIACTAIEHELIIVSEDSDFEKINRIGDPNFQLPIECWKNTISI